jgi:hypothetical protein
MLTRAIAATPKLHFIFAVQREIKIKEILLQAFLRNTVSPPVKWK